VLRGLLGSRYAGGGISQWCLERAVRLSSILYLNVQKYLPHELFVDYGLINKDSVAAGIYDNCWHEQDRPTPDSDARV